jgi:hypothetical protein
MRRPRYGRQPDRSKQRGSESKATTGPSKEIAKSHSLLLRFDRGTGKSTARRPLFYSMTTIIVPTNSNPVIRDAVLALITPIGAKKPSLNCMLSIFRGLMDGTIITRNIL